MSLKPERSESTTQEERLSQKVRSNSIWFIDGNVILEAEGKQFRVHRSILARHSTVFRDMFQLPQPSDESTVEDCPVVCLSDALQDVEHLLHAIYDRLYHNEEKPPFSFVAAMIRLGHKYDCIQLLDDAMARLTTDCPPTLHEWDACGDGYFNLIKPHPNLEMDILELAQEQRLFGILPFAYLSICSTPHNLAKFVGDGPTNMSKDDLLMCIIAAQKLQQATMETFKWLDEVPYVSCTSTACGDRAKELKIEILLDASGRSPHPLCDWDDDWDGLCGECEERSKWDHHCGRKKTWESLPEVFGLPGWSDLRNFD